MEVHRKLTGVNLSDDRDWSFVYHILPGFGLFRQ